MLKFWTKIILILKFLVWNVLVELLNSIDADSSRCHNIYSKSVLEEWERKKSIARYQKRCEIAAAQQRAMLAWPDSGFSIFFKQHYQRTDCYLCTCAVTRLTFYYIYLLYSFGLSSCRFFYVFHKAKQIFGYERD